MTERQRPTPTPTPTPAADEPAAPAPAAPPTTTDRQPDNYHQDFGREAGERGRAPFGRRDAETADPNAAAAADHEEEGEGYRERGRNAVDDAAEADPTP